MPCPLLNANHGFKMGLVGYAENCKLNLQPSQAKKRIWYSENKQ